MKRFEVETTAQGEPFSQLGVQDAQGYQAMLASLGVLPEDAEKSASVFTAYCADADKPVKIDIEPGLPAKARKELEFEEARRLSTVRNCLRTIRSIIGSPPDNAEPVKVETKK